MDAEDDSDDAHDDKPTSNLPSGTTSLPTVDDPTKFSELSLSDRTARAIQEMGFETMTEIQRRAIPPLMAGRDVLVRTLKKIKKGLYFQANNVF